MTGHAGSCRDCAAFENTAAAIERGLPGLAVMGSAHGANRADDGLCARHDRYVRASASCAAFRRAGATGRQPLS